MLEQANNLVTTVGDEPLVSIIIPVFNTLMEHFRRMLESVVGQTYRNLEIIVVDDGSEEENARAYGEICAGDDRVTMLHKENGGVSSARNLGIDSAHGAYIMFMDSDDEMPDYAVEHALNALLDNDLDIAFGLVEYRMEGATSVARPVFEEGQTIRVIEEAAVEDVRSFFFSQELPCSNTNLAGIPRGPVAQIMLADLVKTTPFDTDVVFMEDSIFNAFAVSKASRIGLVDEVWYIYYQNVYSACNNLRLDGSYDTHMAAVAKYYGIDDRLDNDIRAQVCHVFFRAVSNESDRGYKGRLKRIRNALNNPSCASAFENVRTEGYSMSRLRRLNYLLCRKKQALLIYVLYSLRAARDRAHGKSPQ